MSDSALGKKVFTVGKHKGKCFSEVYLQHPGYVSWALQIKDPSGQMLDFCRYARSVTSNISGGDPRASDGNHSGSSHGLGASSAGSSSFRGGSNYDHRFNASSNTQTPKGKPSPTFESNSKGMGNCLEAKWRRITSRIRASSDDEDGAQFPKRKLAMQQRSPVPHGNGPHLLERAMEALVQAKRQQTSQSARPSPSPGATTIQASGARNPLVKTQGITYPSSGDPLIASKPRDMDHTLIQGQPMNANNRIPITTTNILRNPDIAKESIQRQMLPTVTTTRTVPNACGSQVTTGSVAAMLMDNAMKSLSPQPLKRSPESIKLDIEGVLALVLHSATEFHIAFQRQVSDNKSVWSTALPSTLFEFLRALDQGLRIKKEDKQSYIVFDAEKYDTVLKAVRKKVTSSNCNCPVDPIPNFILVTFPAFNKFAKQTKMPEKTKNGLAGKVCEYTEKNMTRIADIVGKDLYDQLKPFQREGLNFGIKNNGRVLIGDEMGLGKTLQALAISAFYCVDWPLLIVCPSSLRFQWRDQCERWLPHLVKKDEICTIKSGKTDIPDHTKIVIISYDLYALNEHFRHGFQIVICDESHYIKNKAAKRTKSLVPLLKETRRAILLSGTPTLNSPSELFEQISGLLPDFCSNNTFVERYCEKKLHWYTKKMMYSGSKHTSELHIFLVSTVMIRRLKEHVLHELPPKLRSKVPIELPKTFLREYKMAMAAHMNDESFEEGKANITKVQEMFKLTGEAKSKAVCEYITHLLKTEVKFIIFAHHMVVMDNIENTLQQNNCNYIRIDGSTSQSKREEYVNRFQNERECTTALLSLTACGVGLNLTASSTVIFAELHWVPGQMIQAEDRAHRMGTKHRAINIHYLIAENSVEETIWRVINRKWKDVTATLNGETSNLTLLKEEEKEIMAELAMQCKIDEMLPLRRSSVGCNQ